MYIKLTDAMRAHGMEELELSWVGDYNLTVTGCTDNWRATGKTHITYRYLFDPNAL